MLWETGQVSSKERLWYSCWAGDDVMIPCITASSWSHDLITEHLVLSSLSSVENSSCSSSNSRGISDIVDWWRTLECWPPPWWGWLPFRRTFRPEWIMSPLHPELSHSSASRLEELRLSLPYSRSVSVMKEQSFSFFRENLSFGSRAFRISPPQNMGYLTIRYGGEIKRVLENWQKTARSPPTIMQSQTLSSFRRHLKTHYTFSHPILSPIAHLQCAPILFWENKTKLYS